MHTAFRPRSLVHAATLCGAFVSTLMLAACGGGGSSAPAPVPTVSTMTTGAVKYSQLLLVTLTGTNLDSDLSVSSAGCKGVTRSMTAPNISSATTAYYQCTASAVGANLVSATRTSNGAPLASAPFTVAVPQVTLSVSNGIAAVGDIVITLAPDKTPITVDNFLNYVNTKFYDGTVFHRVAPAFVIQGGGYGPISVGVTPVLKPTNAPIALEVGKGLSNVQWTVAMARTAAPDSATSQFFFNLVDNVFLDTSGGGYAVFGNVSAGTAVVSAIEGAPCTSLPLFLPLSDCTPIPNVVVTSAVQTR